MTIEVKICGLKTEAALDAALEAGADYVGLVFYAKSPRNVAFDEARALARRAHERSRAKVVALLVDADDALIDRVVREVEPDVLQLHGAETPERVEAIHTRTGRAILKAVGVAKAADVEAAASRYLGPGLADMLLFDAKPPAAGAGLPGGNGLAFDWHILDSQKSGRPFALAGGLGPDNVAAAIRLTGARLVDVSSGVESRPGEKDPELIRRFLRNAKLAKQS